MWTPGAFLNFVFEWLYKILSRKYLFGFWSTNLSLTEKQFAPGQYFISWLVSHGQTLIQSLLLVYEVCPCRRLMCLTVVLQLVRQIWKVLENSGGESSVTGDRTLGTFYSIPLLSSCVLFICLLAALMWNTCIACLLATMNSKPKKRIPL